MTLDLWIEEKESRAMVTGNGVFVAHKGDSIAIIRISKWDDVQKAIEALQRLTQKDVQP